ncbi:MAG: helical backbone metal receptor [Chitinophagaceae bacterium]|jgi:ABC-type Fe3+-hydroxamate transport system substrate-binding protein
MVNERIFTDMMNRQVEITFPPKSIISVVPSQTELLYDLGLEEEVTGITKFCIHPRKWFDSKVRVGGTKKLNLTRILKLNPDLIIANKEENTKEDIEYLASRFPVWISDIRTIDDGLKMIRAVGELTGKANAGKVLATKIRNNFSLLNKTAKPKRIAYFIWRTPWMTVGNDTFIHDVISKTGWQNVYSDKPRYPETSVDELKNLNPELILLSSEPYPFKEKHIAELKKELPLAKIMLVDGEMFSWYGSRMELAAEYLNTLSDSIQ